MIRRFNEARSAGQSVFSSLKASVQPFIDAVSRAYNWVGDLIARIRSLPGVGAISRLVSGGGGGGGSFGSGGLVTTPQRALIGEAGMEAVIPLSRPLSQIDPSVRSMAALLRGKADYATGTNGSAGRVVNASITVNTPATDPVAVAQQVMNRAVEMAG
jgi:hypothetical protein